MISMNVRARLVRVVKSSTPWIRKGRHDKIRRQAGVLATAVRFCSVRKNVCSSAVSAYVPETCPASQAWGTAWRLQYLLMLLEPAVLPAARERTHGVDHT